jgi:hypothetical protein
MRPAGGIGIRACLRNMLIRVRIPGGVPDFSRKPKRFRLLFYNLDVATTPPRVFSWLAVCTAGARGGVAGFLSSNREDGGPSSRRCGFKSRRERQRQLAVAQRASARRSGRRDRRFESCRRDQYLFLRSSVEARARGCGPRGRGFESLRRCQPRRRNSEERVPACRAGGRGFKSRRRRQQHRRVLNGESSWLLTRRLQVQVLPRRPMLG